MVRLVCPTSRCRGGGHATVALTALLLSAVLAPHAAVAAPLGASAVAAGGRDSLLAAAVPMTGPRTLLASAFPAPAPGATAAPAGGFTLRRVANPHYRPPVARPPGFPNAAWQQAQALDHARARLSRRGMGTAGAITDWELAAGEQGRSQDAVELTTAGLERGGHHELRALRLDGRRGPTTASLGDVPPVGLGRLASLQRLRGATLGGGLPGGTTWQAAGGVPARLRGLAAPRLAVGGVALDELPIPEAAVSLGIVGFGKRGRTAARFTPAGDSLHGGGGAAQLGVRALLPFGSLGLTTVAQYHDLDGHGGLAAQQVWEWRLATPRLVLAMQDARATGRTVLVGGDRLVAAARREDHWNAQARWFRGRGETHFTGLVREGGDPTLSTRTLQLGGSAGWGASAWYSGVEYTTVQHALTPSAERRLALHTGRIAPGGAALLLRLERATNDHGRDVRLASAEASLPLAYGARATLEPRLGWDARRLEQGTAEARITLPLGSPVARLTGAVTVGAAREQDFRARVREASLAVSLVPRARDRTDFEARRLSDGGTRALEATAAYDLRAERFARPDGWLAERDSGRVTVQVIRAGNGSGVAEVLVTLDGRELRFTDADGVARFEHVPSGVHVVSIEERSLPLHHEVVSATRVFVTIEPGQPVPPAVFEIARPARRTRF